MHAQTVEACAIALGPGSVKTLLSPARRADVLTCRGLAGRGRSSGKANRAAPARVLHRR